MLLVRFVIVFYVNTLESGSITLNTIQCLTTYFSFAPTNHNTLDKFHYSFQIILLPVYFVCEI